MSEGVYHKDSCRIEASGSRQCVYSVTNICLLCMIVWHIIPVAIYFCDDIA